MLEKKVIDLPSDLYEKHATIYRDSKTDPKACLLYFHGGGLLYGIREDLPNGHIAAFTKAGYLIVSFDYPLAPAAGADRILSDVCSSINDFFLNCREYVGISLPFFLWGRSAGAYLCLLTASRGQIPSPLGVISYYGYGLLNDGWFQTPNSYYRSLPSVDETCLKNVPSFCHADGPLDTHYSVYVHARQTGTWMDMIYTGREKLFYLNYTLRTCNYFPYPLFCAHSIQDPDVPYSEFTALTERYHSSRFVAPGREHDFDRDEKSPVTAKLLEATIAFLNASLISV